MHAPGSGTGRKVVKSLHMPQLTHLDSDRNVAVLVSQVHVNDDGFHKQINIVRALQELMTSLVLLLMFA